MANAPARHSEAEAAVRQELTACEARGARLHVGSSVRMVALVELAKPLDRGAVENRAVEALGLDSQALLEGLIETARSGFDVAVDCGLGERGNASASNPSDFNGLERLLDVVTLPTR